MYFSLFLLELGYLINTRYPSAEAVQGEGEEREWEGIKIYEKAKNNC